LIDFAGLTGSIAPGRVLLPQKPTPVLASPALPGTASQRNNGRMLNKFQMAALPFDEAGKAPTSEQNGARTAPAAIATKAP
jgi:hypothetical protein